jgi:hypothetical protein
MHSLYVTKDDVCDFKWCEASHSPQGYRRVISIHGAARRLRNVGQWRECKKELGLIEVTLRMQTNVNKLDKRLCE